jgi:hypothetical protein
MSIARESMFEQIDLFSKSFEFTFAGKEKFRSNIGGYFTVMTLFIGIYWVYLLGNEILYRNLPRNNQVISMRSAPVNETLKVPTAFMVQDYRGKVFRDFDRQRFFR